MKKKKYLLYGMGITNQSVKTFFLHENIEFLEYTDNDIKYDLTGIDIIVKSPGIKQDTKLLEDAKKQNIPVINDLELFYLFYPKSKLIIITGTNGKTSTSRMLSIVISKKYKCYLGGNIGLPLFSLKSNKKFVNEIVIVEASSFMLENCYKVKPYIYAITNISNHHLDYHKSIENYVNAKSKLINNLEPNSLLLIPSNLSLEIPNDLNVIRFDESGTNKNIKINENKLLLDEYHLYGFNDYLLVPKHQLQNMSIVSEIALFLNISKERIRKGLEDVTCEKYRLQVVYKDVNTTIINDAKSTNLNSSLAAIESIKTTNKDIYWILGGHGDVNSDLFKNADNVNKYYLYGENKEQLECILKSLNKETFKYESLDEVVTAIKDNDDKKIILFSPASQSYDQYENFEERGKHFDSLVNKYWHN